MPDMSSLKEKDTRTKFLQCFEEVRRDFRASDSNENAWFLIESHVKKSMEHLPKKRAAANKPWIGTESLRLIDRREDARQAHRRVLGRQLTKQIKVQVKKNN